ncbi:MAG: glycosyltransferase [Candidatus Tritonobacter lacicola]|nr:glycosyltransferase [Candidatus Tritonobacter lacicola]
MRDSTTPGAPLRLALVMDELCGGGAERVALTLLAHLDRRLYEPWMVLFKKRGELLDQVPAGVPLVDLGASRIRFGGMRLIRALRRVSPAVVMTVGCVNGLAAWAARLTLGPGIPIWARETNSPVYRFDRSRRGARLEEALCRWSYRRAVSGLICLSRRMAMEFKDAFRLPYDPVTIGNPVDIARTRALAGEHVDHRWFREDGPLLVAVGRLTRQKGFDLLLEAMAMVRTKPPARLIILGRGEDEERLRDSVGRLALEERVELPGFRLNPYPFMKRATALVLPSRWEGFGNVIVEAMCLGTPVVASDCRWGPGEIITHGRDGLLVPPEEPGALAGALTAVISRPGLASALSGGGLRRAESFEAGAITGRYERILSGAPSRK